MLPVFDESRPEVLMDMLQFILAVRLISYISKHISLSSGNSATPSFATRACLKSLR